MGRASELAQIDSALAALERGAASVIGVQGELGVGKSRLLAELSARAEERSCVTLTGRAAEFGRGEPFGPFVDALDEYLGALGGRPVDRLGSDRSEELRAIFPSLAIGRPPDRVQADRYRFHHAVRALLEAISEARPVVLMLDDLHWADPASVELVLHLLRRRPAAPVLLALAFRPREAPAALLTSLERATADGAAVRLEPQALTREQADALMEEVVGGDLRDRLYRESGGNPFYLEQLVRSSRSGPQRIRDAGTPVAGAGVPPLVAASMAQELDRLTAGARVLAEGAAVVGDPFEPDVAAIAAGVPEADALAALDELLDADLVRSDETPRRFRFRHPIVRRAVYESAGAGWRLGAHRRVAAQLAERGASALSRAPHVERSAAAGDRDAMSVLVEAAESATARAPETAARWYQAAIDLLPDGDVGGGRRLELLVSLATCLGSAGRLEESRDTLREALALLPPDASAVRSRAIAFIALLERMLGNHGAATAMLRDALQRVTDERSEEATLLKIELAFDSFFRVEFEPMHEWAEQALVAARPLGNDMLVAGAAGVLGLSLYNLGQIDAAAHCVEESAALIDALPDGMVAELLDMFFYVGWTEHSICRYEDSVRHFERGLAIARATGQGYLLVPFTIGKAVPLTWRGELAEADRLAAEAMDMSHVSRNDLFMAWALTMRCAVRSRMGELEEAIQLGEEAVGLVRKGGHRVLSGALAGCYLAEPYLELGEPGHATELVLRWGGGDSLSAIEPSYRSHWFELLARAALAQGSLAEAEDWAGRAAGAAEGVSLPVRAAEARSARAAVLIAREEWAQAATAALSSAELATAAGDRLYAARARILAGRALAGAGRREPAVDALQDAEAELDGFGARRYRDEARRELRKLGRHNARKAGRRRAIGQGTHALSRREREVAELVSAGKTNREISATLFIGEKTVESHLSSIFGKLGVSSRASVAAMVERDRSRAA